MKKSPFHSNLHYPILLVQVLLAGSLLANNVLPGDTCMVNEQCETAIVISNVVSDESFVCVDGCNRNAAPTSLNNICGTLGNPTAWFKVVSDNLATRMDIKVTTPEFNHVIISVLTTNTNCNNLQPVVIDEIGSPCIGGSQGFAETYRTVIRPNTAYYIAVTARNAEGGDFEICVRTLNLPVDYCVTGANIEVKSRSSGGDLSGPFLPGETISICMNVHSYTAAGNGCQWFQGLIPTFGDGWDPANFDVNQQPIGATVNGLPIGVPGNGLYGASTWEWFDDVDYHYTNNIIQVGDFDGNGTLESCKTTYDPDCPNMGGVKGGCCGPCWGNPKGTALSPGWFAHGINGTCPYSGHPSQDWGDGNTCGSGMGPWQFCFDLKVRPKCKIFIPGHRDLKLGFITTADGETGAWTGGLSNCIYDLPVIRKFDLDLGELQTLPADTLPAMCPGEILDYVMFFPDVQQWDWEFLAEDKILMSGQSENGMSLLAKIPYYSDTGYEMTVWLSGLSESNGVCMLKQISFWVYPGISIHTHPVVKICNNFNQPVTIHPNITGGTGNLSFLWFPGGDTTASIVITPPINFLRQKIIITDELGCSRSQDFIFIGSDCSEDDDGQGDDVPTPEDPPILDGNFYDPEHFPEIAFRSEKANPVSNESHLLVYPVPAQNRVIIEWPFMESGAIQLIISSPNGYIHHTIDMQHELENRKAIDLSDLPSGLYFVLLRTKNRLYTARLVRLAP